VSSCTVGEPIFLFSLAVFQVRVGAAATREGDEIAEEVEDMVLVLLMQTAKSSVRY